MKCRNCKNLGKLMDENGEPYDWCEKVCDNTDIHAERNCKHYVVASNADRIRSMSDEELCDEYFRILNHELWKYTDSRAGLFDWLRQEAE